MLDLRALRVRCEERLQGMMVPQPFNLKTFVAEVSRHRGRQLVLAELPEQHRGSLTGMWMALEPGDVVFVEPAASPYHRSVIALHEIGHILWGHNADADLADYLAETICPDLSASTIRKLLVRARHRYSSEEEQEAELTAALIMARSETGPPPGLYRQDSSLLRLAEALKHPVRHV